MAVIYEFRGSGLARRRLRRADSGVELALFPKTNLDTQDVTGFVSRDPLAVTFIPTQFDIIECTREMVASGRGSWVIKAEISLVKKALADEGHDVRIYRRGNS